MVELLAVEEPDNVDSQGVGTAEAVSRGIVKPAELSARPKLVPGMVDVTEVTT
jgi:hypothetical protein